MPVSVAQDHTCPVVLETAGNAKQTGKLLPQTPCPWLAVPLALQITVFTRHLSSLKPTCEAAVCGSFRALAGLIGSSLLYPQKTGL